jgi:2-polyprenyl-6-methoxyphenol hydroxylase-like FAD-dependent oxidoreductase
VRAHLRDATGGEDPNGALRSSNAQYVPTQDSHKSPDQTTPPIDLPILIVGAGPTGLALAAQLRWLGTPFRMIDRSIDRAHESRALAVQARTLELFDSIGLADPLVALGRTSTRLVLHSGTRTLASVTLGGVDDAETRYPFILFVSQAETERVLSEHLAAADVTIERDTELISFEAADTHVDCLLRLADGREEHVRTAYLVGCDGAHSLVRKDGGFTFEGGSYPEEFVLADVEADGPLEPEAINPFIGGGGVAMFFPLGRPTTWRVIAMATQADHTGVPNDDAAPASSLSLAELQAIVDAPTEATVRVRDPAWLTRFHLHHRQTAHYRAGRLFLAGDAAHIHSPVGGQGMNTGIQDAWNLGWKLALVVSGVADEQLLESYEAERWRVGRLLLRFTDRIFGVFTRAMSAGRLASWLRAVAMPHVLPHVIGSSRLRSTVFRFVSELAIRYRQSPIVEEAEPRLHGGPRAGDRFPDVNLTMYDRAVSMQRAVVGPHLTLLLCGDEFEWDATQLGELSGRFGALLVIRHLSMHPSPAVLVDPTGDVLARLAARDGAQYLVRPDGYIAFRCAGYDVAALESYLARWFSPEER